MGVRHIRALRLALPLGCVPCDSVSPPQIGETTLSAERGAQAGSWVDDWVTSSWRVDRCFPVGLPGDRARKPRADQSSRSRDPNRRLVKRTATGAEDKPPHIRIALAETAGATTPPGGQSRSGPPPARSVWDGCARQNPQGPRVLPPLPWVGVSL